MFHKVDLGGFFFSGLWDLVEDNSEEKPFVAILSRSIHIMPGLLCNSLQASLIITSFVRGGGSESYDENYTLG